MGRDGGGEEELGVAEKLRVDGDGNGNGGGKGRKRGGWRWGEMGVERRS
jgi:hypothetical protein